MSLSRIRELCAGFQCGNISSRLDTPGFQLGLPDSFKVYRGNEIPAGLGIVFEGEQSSKNWLIIADGHALSTPFKVRLHARAVDNVVVIREKSLPFGYISINSSGCLAYFGQGMRYAGHFEVVMSGNGSLFYFGCNGSPNGLSAYVTGDSRSILIGEDAMISHRVALMTSDVHPIVDLSSSEWLNPPADIIIEPHVWLGRESVVMKGVEIKSGTTIGSRAVVTKTHPENCVLAGIPAKVVRNNVAWLRSGIPSPAALNEVKGLHSRVSAG